MEVWKPVPGTAYEASNAGRVRHSVRRRILKHYIRRQNGYAYVAIKPGASRRLSPMSVHRAVCSAFHGPPVEPRIYTRHLDGDQTNNTPSNLVWGTHKENESDKELHGTRPRGDRHANSILREGEVKEIRLYPRFKGLYEMLSDYYGVCKTTIKFVRTGRHWSHVS